MGTQTSRPADAYRYPTSLSVSGAIQRIRSCYGPLIRNLVGLDIANEGVALRYANVRLTWTVRKGGACKFPSRCDLRVGVSVVQMLTVAGFAPEEPATAASG
ncbi:hypothetical protein Poly51_59120 [Rubripirellula tenax]|uniref:Uncharacterized protein n=1 Tax=Rubripirellula tenax TaxID=2528015 RepID=A0A5C6E4Q6_9BACT|nr:hypothetical protein Poly51_59120 [Rubripirellula tenax]